MYREVIEAAVTDEAEELAVEESYADEAPEHTPAVVAFDHHAWRFIRHHNLEAVALRIIEAFDDPAEIPPTVRALLRRYRAPGAVVIGVTKPRNLGDYGCRRRE